ncbi:MAG: hypothetical protein Q8M16_01490 [Pirellulaceae bacterium]|nr:hypothetical protein [Pirellulaceae bacterium]
MLAWWKPLDKLLRGDLGVEVKQSSQEIAFPVGHVIVLTIVLAFIFGASIGSFTAVSAKDTSQGWQQLLASTVKAPLLFYLTLLVTFPSLYVFNALMGSNLDIRAAFRLLVAAIAVIVAILASLGPIIAFFAFSTPSGLGGYRFILILVVFTTALSGCLGLQYLLRMLNRHANAEQPTSVPIDNRPSQEGSPEIVMAESTENRTIHSAISWRSNSSVWSPAQAIFRVWVLVFAIVGAQMSWVLRPFIGSPDREFTWFRERTGNFFQAVAQVILDVFAGS